MKKRSTALLLLTAMLSSLAACGDSSTTLDTSSAEDTTTAPIEEETYSLGKYLEQQDLDGFTYTILAFAEYAIETIYTDEETGSLVSDAVFNKLRTVEEFLNCDIVLSEASITDNTTGANETKTSIMSGEYEFDLVMAHDISLANMSLEGLFVNVMELDTFNFDAEWWPQKTIDSVRVGDTMYLMSNNVSYYPVSDTRALYFNKQLLADNHIDAPYSLVDDGTWTFDKFNSLVASLYRDVNGNTKQDEEDIYGFTNRSSYYAWLEALNVEFYIEDENGTLSYQFDTERNSQIVETLYDLLFNSGGTYIATGSVSYNDIFSNGNSAFIYSELRTAVNEFSFSDVQYGILPMPKLDDTQETYYGGCTDRPTAIPVTVPEENLDQVALITEALNIEGYYTVFPVYFETALKTRYSETNDDARMIDIIYDNRLLSFSYLYGDFSGASLQMLQTLLAPSAPSTDVASYAAKIQSAQEKRVETLNKWFSK